MRYLRTTRVGILRNVHCDKTNGNEKKENKGGRSETEFVMVVKADHNKSELVKDKLARTWGEANRFRAMMTRVAVSKYQRNMKMEPSSRVHSLFLNGLTRKD